jgi:H+/Cl- antiporter ClcA
LDEALRISFANRTPFAIGGVCGYLARVTQASLTALVTVMEMSSPHAMVLPLMITAAVAPAASRVISPAPHQTLPPRFIEPAAKSADLSIRGT